MDELQGNIRQLMKFQRLNSVGLAEKIGVSKQYISQILSGKQDIRISTLSKIAKALGVSLEELVKTNTEVLVPEIIKTPNDNLKVSIQIELDPNPGSNSIKMIFGQAFLDQLKK